MTPCGRADFVALRLKIGLCFDQKAASHRGILEHSAGNSDFMNESATVFLTRNTNRIFH